jgi:hypothetical protein
MNTTPPFTLGQRVRIKQYVIPDDPAWSIPHFIVGHFGHIVAIVPRYFDVKISHGPDGGPPDSRIVDDGDENGIDGVWPMLVEELEAVD